MIKEEWADIDITKDFIFNDIEFESRFKDYFKPKLLVVMSKNFLDHKDGSSMKIQGYITVQDPKEITQSHKTHLFLTLQDHMDEVL